MGIRGDSWGVVEAMVAVVYVVLVRGVDVCGVDRVWCRWWCLVVVSVVVYGGGGGGNVGGGGCVEHACIYLKVCRRVC